MYLTWRAPAAMVLSALAVFAVPHTWLVLGWASLLLALVALDVILAPRPSALTCERAALGSIHLGEGITSTLHLTNAGTRRMRGAVRDVWLPAAGASREPGADSTELDLAPGSNTQLDVDLHPRRRGFRRTDRVTVRTCGPLRFAGRQQSREVPGVVQVLPAFASRREIPSRIVQLREIEGHSQVRSFGRGSEFDSLREYVRGDDVRSIDWRATARHRSPVIRTWRPERDRHVVIFLDTSRLSAGRIGDTTRLDAGMDAALLLAALAAHAGDSVTWMAGARTIDAEVNISASRGGAAIRPILTAMAPLESQLVEPDWRATTRHLQEEARQGALIVLITPFAPAVIEDSLLPLLPSLASRHRVVIASVCDPELTTMSASRDNVRDVYEAAAAEHIRVRTDDLKEIVGSLGVGVLDLTAEHLPAALADRYLQLKKDGLL